MLVVIVRYLFELDQEISIVSSWGFLIDDDSSSSSKQQAVGTSDAAQTC